MQSNRRRYGSTLHDVVVRDLIAFCNGYFWFVTPATWKASKVKAEAANQGEKKQEASVTRWWNCTIMIRVACMLQLFSIHRDLSLIDYWRAVLINDINTIFFCFQAERNPLNLSLLHCVRWKKRSGEGQEENCKMQYGIYNMKECMQILIKHINFPVFPVLGWTQQHADVFCVMCCVMASRLESYSNWRSFNAGNISISSNNETDSFSLFLKSFNSFFLFLI